MIETRVWKDNNKSADDRLNGLFSLITILSACLVRDGPISQAHQRQHTSHMWKHGYHFTDRPKNKIVGKITKNKGEKTWSFRIFYFVFFFSFFFCFWVGERFSYFLRWLRRNGAMRREKMTCIKNYTKTERERSRERGLRGLLSSSVYTLLSWQEPRP